MLNYVTQKSDIVSNKRLKSMKKIAGNYFYSAAIYGRKFYYTTTVLLVISFKFVSLLLRSALVDPWTRGPALHQ